MAELVITRIFDAPREQVYRAFTDPVQLARWFGPVGWSVPRESVDVDDRVGGPFSFTMVNDADPDDTSPVTAVFREVVKNELLVGHEEDVQGRGDITEMTVRLEFYDEGEGKTRLVLRQGPFDEATGEMAREGWLSSFTKLDRALG
ncbi:MAG TPA: SRPBCC domain-containing protein [Asanoa sp.]